MVAKTEIEGKQSNYADEHMISQLYCFIENVTVQRKYTCVPEKRDMA